MYRLGRTHGQNCMSVLAGASGTRPRGAACVRACPARRRDTRTDDVTGRCPHSI